MLGLCSTLAFLSCQRGWRTCDIHCVGLSLSMKYACMYDNIGSVFDVGVPLVSAGMAYL